MGDDQLLLEGGSLPLVRSLLKSTGELSKPFIDHSVFRPGNRPTLIWGVSEEFTSLAEVCIKIIWVKTGCTTANG